MSRIEEKELLLPALYAISQNRNANTTKIKDILIEVFQPDGEDGMLLDGRQDTKFSQKVRNLLGSHYHQNGMSLYTTKDENGIFTLTDKGEKIVADNLDVLVYQFSNRFSYNESSKMFQNLHKIQGDGKTLYVYSEEHSVTEGKATVREIKIKERSKKLREAAIKNYTKDGKIVCAVCGFDFSKFYGPLGDRYIQIHHETPIYQYSDSGFETYLEEAIKNTKPLCANCHCMIHRSPKGLLTIDELKEIIEKAKISQD